MSQFIVHKDEVDRVFNPERHDVPPIGIHMPNLRELRLPQNFLSIPSSPVGMIRELPTKIVNVVEGVEETIDAISQLSIDLGREVAYLPHRASHKWRQLFWVLFLLVLVPLVVVGIVFFVPMNSVNDGIDGNRRFLYGILTFYEGLFLVAWVETFNFAQPRANISPVARFIGWLFGILFASLIDALVSEDYVGPSVFPIPFSILISGMLSVLVVVVPVLFTLTPALRQNGYSGMLKLVGVYCTSLLIVTLWAVGINRLKHAPVSQTVVGLLYAPLRFICKIVIASPVTTKHNPQRWIQLNLVVDMLFTRVQVATFPFIDSIVTLLFLFLTEVLTLLWRFYNGVDRVSLWWNMVQILKRKDNCTGDESLKPTFLNITYGCIRAPIINVASMHLKLNDSDNNPKSILRTLTETTNCESVTSNGALVEKEPEGTSTKLEQGHPSFIGNREIPPAPVVDIESACSIADHQAKLRAIHQVKPTDNNITSDDESIDSAPCDTDSQQEITREVIHRGLSLVSNSTRTSTQQEKYCEQRVLYHLVDSTGAIVISIITRMSQQFCITMVRNLPSSRHLNESFQIREGRWTKAQIYGWTYVVLMIVLLSRLGCLFFNRIQGFQERELSLSRLMAYLYKNNFWFFFYWLLSTGALVCASMVNHFGADFSLGFEWVSCPGETVWPSCIVE